MSPTTCPSCNAALSPQELREGWCEKCGKKIPSWVQSNASPVGRAGHLPMREEPRIVRSLTYGPLAPRGARLAAAFLDGAVAFSIYALAIALLHALGAYDSEAAEDTAGSLILVGLGILFLVQAVLLSARGQTIGKMIMRIRIVRLHDESNPGFLGAVLLRAVVPGLIGAIPCLGPLFGLADILYIFADDQRCLHDHIAGTKVISA